MYNGRTWEHLGEKMEHRGTKEICEDCIACPKVIDCGYATAFMALPDPNRRIARAGWRQASAMARILARSSWRASVSTVLH